MLNVRGISIRIFAMVHGVGYVGTFVMVHSVGGIGTFAIVHSVGGIGTFFYGAQYCECRNICYGAQC